MTDKRNLSSRTPDQVVQLISDALGVATNQLNPNSVAQNHPEWDSMGMLAILAALGREGIHLDPGDVAALDSVEGILGVFRAAGRFE